MGARHFLRRADARQKIEEVMGRNCRNSLLLQNVSSWRSATMDSARAFETSKSTEEEASSWVHDPFTTADVTLDIDDDGVPFHWDPDEATENTDTEDLPSMVFQSLQNLLATEQPLTTPTSDLLFQEEEEEEEDSPHNAPTTFIDTGIPPQESEHTKQNKNSDQAEQHQSPNTNNNHKHIMASPKAKMFCWGFAFVVVCVIIGVLATSFKKVPSTEMGVQYNVHKKQLDDATKSGGLFAGPPGYQFVKFPSTFITVDVNNRECVSNDGLLVVFSVTFQVRYYLLNTSCDMTLLKQNTSIYTLRVY